MQNESFHRSHPTQQTRPNSAEIERVIQDVIQNHHHYMVKEMCDLKKVIFTLSKECTDRDSHASLLAKMFDRFVRDFTHHMDTEEQLLFPMVISYATTGRVTLDPFSKEQLIHQLSDEDRAVGSELGRICEVARRLAKRAIHPLYQNVLNKLKEIENNLAIHTEKERRYITPYVARLLGPRLRPEAETNDHSSRMEI